jgi:hypothetical protein
MPEQTIREKVLARVAHLVSYAGFDAVRDDGFANCPAVLVQHGWETPVTLSFRFQTGYFGMVATGAGLVGYAEGVQERRCKADPGKLLWRRTDSKGLEVVMAKYEAPGSVAEVLELVGELLEHAKVNGDA